MEGRPRAWAWALAAVMGTGALAVGLWLLLAPMHLNGESCGSAVDLSLPRGDDAAPYFCFRAQGPRLADGWPLAAVGGFTAAISAARLVVVRRDAWLWA